MYRMMAKCAGRLKRYLKLVGVVTFLAVIVILARPHAKTGNPRDEYMKYVEYATEAELTDPFLHKHTYKLLINEEETCNGNVFLLIYVLSHPSSMEMRQAIRHTWGSISYIIGDHTDAQIRVIFLFGAPKSVQEQTNISVESNEYHDIIEGDFTDDYLNLTYKSVMGLHWVNRYCSKARFVLKIDDDVMLNIYKLVNFLQDMDKKSVNEPGILYCHVEAPGVGVIPVRDTESKFFLSLKEYPYGLYPPYCNGPGYVFSGDVASRLYEATMHVPHFRFEDIYIGFCAHFAEIDFTDDFHGFYMDAYNDPKKDFGVTILKHPIRSMESWRSAWDQIQHNRARLINHSVFNIALCVIICTIQRKISKL